MNFDRVTMRKSEVGKGMKEQECETTRSDGLSIWFLGTQAVVYYYNQDFLMSRSKLSEAGGQQIKQEASESEFHRGHQ